DVMQRLMVPYEFDAKTMEPLRSSIAQSIDFDRLNAGAAPSLFINATDINTVHMRVFSRPEITLDALCASSCLPFLFHPVEIDGAKYWDGGFMGNPAITPLVYGCKSPDILLIETEPTGRRATPTTAAGVIERMSEISFTATLAREVEMIALQAGAGAETLKRRPRMPKTYLHRIAPASDLEAEGGRGYSKFNAEWSYLRRLKELGQQAAERWLEANFDKLGQTTTVDLQDRFE
ncbi:MAG: patatin-like phospholipase family protein, partial [Alphaproteobacteria bacterium]